MKHILILSLLTVLLGCSKQDGSLGLSGTGGSGNLVPLVVLCATNRGGYVPAGPLPAVQASWTHQSRDLQDIILVSGDHFAAVQEVLEKAYGPPDGKLGSSGPAPLGPGKALTYSAQQCGVVLNLTGDSKQTIVTVMGRKR